MHAYVRVGILHDVENVLTSIMEAREKRCLNIEFYGFIINDIYSLRYDTYLKGMKCKYCGLEGIYWAIEKYPYKTKKDKKNNIFNTDNKYHLNLYGTDENGAEVMLTSDHIIPKSRGGSNSIDNRQPLCARCNYKKRSYLEDELILSRKGHIVGFRKQKKEGANCPQPKTLKP